MHIIKHVFAADPIIGNITNPLLSSSYGGVDTPGKGIVLLVTNLLRLFFLVAGMLALFNFIIAGFQYMTAGGDSKKLQSAWDRIWQSLLGLIIVVGSFAFASLFGYLIFGDAGFILNPKIYGP